VHAADVSTQTRPF
jgi:hypothetical protein